MQTAVNNKNNLSDKDFDRLSAFIYKKCGIHLTQIKKMMVQSRLSKILQHSKFDNYTDYLTYAMNSAEGNNDLIELIDVITTNKTDFFREPIHYDFLKNTWLPKLSSQNRSFQFRVWSAGCSTGAEAFTTAFVLEEYKKINSTFDYNIFASDISTKVLKMAKNAIYNLSEVDVVPYDLKKKYLLKSKNQAEKIVRIVPELRKKVEFEYLNLIDNDYKLKRHFDLIFCRNVLIYFDHQTRESIISKLCSYLKTDSLLFLGHSESIINMDLPLQQIQPSIFVKV